MVGNRHCFPYKKTKHLKRARELKERRGENKSQLSLNLWFDLLPCPLWITRFQVFLVVSPPRGRVAWRWVGETLWPNPIWAPVHSPSVCAFSQRVRHIKGHPKRSSAECKWTIKPLGRSLHRCRLMAVLAGSATGKWRKKQHTNGGLIFLLW